MSSDWYQDVLEFHKACEHHIELVPSIPPAPVYLLRCSLIQEEVKEVLEALDHRNLAEIADGIADSIVVLLGTAISYGIDIRPVWTLVHESNMRKAGGGKREDGKSLKPIGWVSPDIKGEIRRQQDGTN